LKACVLVRLAGALELIFDDRRFSEKCWTHNLPQLVELAGLGAILDADMKADQNLLTNWEAARDWTEASRYFRTSRGQATVLYKAVTDKRHGVLSWIKARW
jgi:hypothetical protein